MSLSKIQNNLNIARQRIAEASKKSDVKDVTIIGITKTRNSEQIADLILSGCENIGENRVQEWEDKRQNVIDELNRRSYQGQFRCHLVGHLQSNKAKKALTDFDMIQSVDSVDLARRIDRIAKEEGKISYPCLIQVKLGDEETKSGISKEELYTEFESFISLSNIRVVGLMHIAPLWAIGEDARPYFREMRGIFNNLKKQHDSRYEMKYLSMGMSADFDIAVEEGANMVRIGRALFNGFESI